MSVHRRVGILVAIPRRIAGSKMLEGVAPKLYLGYLVALGFLAVFGTQLAPYGPTETVFGPDGALLRGTPPSTAHPLGTTSQGYDVLSRVVIGAQPTVMAGAIGGTMIITIGLTVGMTSGYLRGRVDDVLMRITDLFYAVPLLPLAIVLIGFFGIGFFESIFVIGAVLWRGSARVIRSQVLQIRERPFIRAAEAAGASTPYIIRKHILPNVASMAVLFFALGAGFTIIIQAGLAFIGVINPFVPSYGVMIRNAFRSGQMATAWWWSIPPALMLSLTVVSTFLLGRRYEKTVAGEDEDAFVEAG